MENLLGLENYTGSYDAVFGLLERKKINWERGKNFVVFNNYGESCIGEGYSLIFQALNAVCKMLHSENPK
jgi:hypothetical protein